MCYNIIVKRNGKEQNKKIKKVLKKVLTNPNKSVIIKTQVKELKKKGIKNYDKQRILHRSYRFR